MMLFKKLPLEITADYMSSDNYRERFVAEYVQTKIRYERLKAYNNRIEAANAVNKPEPPHDCPFYMLREQQEAMGKYLHILEIRAEIECILLDEYIALMVEESFSDSCDETESVRGE